MIMLGASSIFILLSIFYYEYIPEDAFAKVNNKLRTAVLLRFNLQKINLEWFQDEEEDAEDDTEKVGEANKAFEDEIEVSL